MAKKLAPKDAEKLRRREAARRKQDPIHYVCEDPQCHICAEVGT